GDGKPALAVTHSGRNNITVLLGKGDGTFQPMGPFVTSMGPQSIAPVDVNRDGKLDLVVIANLMNNDHNDLNILLGNGDGTLQAPLATPVLQDGGWAGLAVGDYNGDQKVDVALTGCLPICKAYFASVLLGNGNGTFGAATNFPV